MPKSNFYDRRYAGDAFYWGEKHSKMCERLLQFVQPSETNKPSLIDLGCGKGHQQASFV